ncbi:hypothetical protein [Pseudomonas siliginis]|uniref:hypothetical protein n=1 Tax=Pseudomonas siliginis TaxID=2842346 RepID=UPI002092A85A|nr:hypothetical protein [Pseudomonas siliginis]UST77216.1 hypothetical protein NF676_00100 [Pseudomonas siliginis]
MSNTVSLTVHPGQQALVLSTDGVLALQRWERLRDRANGMTEGGAEFAAACLLAKDAASDLALLVRAAVDVANQ